MDRIRGEEKGAFDQNSVEMEKGLNGIKMTLKVLNDYYAKANKAHSPSDGASSGIIGLPEVCESDFSKGLKEMKAAEESAITTYETETKQNQIKKATKAAPAQPRTTRREVVVARENFGGSFVAVFPRTKKGGGGEVIEAEIVRDQFKFKNEAATALLQTNDKDFKLLE